MSISLSSASVHASALVGGFPASALVSGREGADFTTSSDDGDAECLPTRTDDALPLDETGCNVSELRLHPGDGYAPPHGSHTIAVAHRAVRRIVWEGDCSTRIARLRRTGSVIIPSDEKGKLYCDEAASFTAIHLSEERVARCAAVFCRDMPTKLQLHLSNEDGRIAALVEMLTEQQAPHGECRLFVQRCLDVLCAYLISHHSHDAPAVRHVKRGLAEWQVDRVIEYMRKHLDLPISLEDLAAQIGLSRFHFCTAFRLATGQTPHEYLRELRIETAAKLLLESRHSIAEIALAVGYETPSSFTARFGRQMGVTPTEFRSRNDNIFASQVEPEPAILPDRRHITLATAREAVHA